jgi:hypothetical protein
MKTRIFLVKFAVGILGVIVGHVVVGLFTHNHNAQFLGAAVCAVLAVGTLRLVPGLWVALFVPGGARVLVRSLVRAPEGGYLPRGLPKDARAVASALEGARTALRFVKPDRRAPIMEQALTGIRQSARDATIAGHADAIREVLRFREPCAGPPDIQAAWVQLLAAAREGIAEGEASPSVG